MRSWLAGILALVVAGSTIIQPVPAAAEPFPAGVWTESAYVSVFRDSLPSADAGSAVRLDAARNEYEAGQIVLRANDAFTVDAVRFTGLTGPAGSIAAEHLTANFVGYQYLNRNTSVVYPLIRTGPGDYPDRLLNAKSIAVPARTTQSIWIRAFIPPTTPAGVYGGSVSVQTTRGTHLVPISVDVRNVTLPDSENGSFTSTLWHSFTGPGSWDEQGGDMIDDTYHYSRYTPQYWDLMDKVARTMRQNRTNDFMIPIVRHLMDAGSKQRPDGTFDFNWSRFDEMTQFMMDRGAVKRLEGFWLAGYQPNTPFLVETINTEGKRTWVPWDSPAAKHWVQHFVPALRDHIRAKGWEQRFWTHVGDEPHDPAGVAVWRAHAAQIRAQWPNVKLADAVFEFESHRQIIDLVDVMIPETDLYEENRAFYDQKRAEGKELWVYGSQSGNYLYRAIDQPQWNQRLTMWGAYGRGATGHLHWGMNNWKYPMDIQDPKGDGYIVRADVPGNTIESTPRYESLRDGIEDYEVLNLLGKRDPALAKGIADSLIQRFDQYTPDTSYMQRIRAIALDMAADKPIAPDLARNVATTASSGNPALAVDGNPATSWQPAAGTQWIRLDFGRQIQLDGVRPVWSTSPAGFKLQTSYDGSRWADIPGSGAFVGANAKARYLRVEVTSPAALASLEVAGFALTRPNLAGGRTYARSVKPDDRFPDSNYESTDGVLGDAWGDGRTWGYQAPATTAEVTIDLGSAQLVNNAKLHAYEEYPDYRPSNIKVATSTDNVTFTQRGLQSVPLGASGIWYDFTFPAVQARYVKVTFTKAYTTSASVMLLDEIEVYAAAKPNLLDRARYAKSQPAPTDPPYPDTGDRESTDGTLAGGFWDGRGYGYQITNHGQTFVLDLLLDLGANRSPQTVRVARYDDGVRDYAPGKVQVFGGDDPLQLALRRETTTANGKWFELPVTEAGRYLQVRLIKTRTHDLAGYLFVDEVEVLDAAGTNLARGLPYVKSHPAVPDPAYPDSGDRELTDTAVAGGFSDGVGFGYRLMSAGETRTVDVLVDLGAARTLSTVQLHQYESSVHDYDPDLVRVWTGDSPVGMTLAGETATPSNGWFEIALPGTSTRYLKVQVVKTRVNDISSYLFLDELTATA